MDKNKVQKLKHGVYIIFWKSGGKSLASIGSMPNGERWVSPCNWVGFCSPKSKFAKSRSNFWRMILGVKKIKVNMRRG